MDTEKFPYIHTITTDAPVARIDTPDELFTEPMREFLSSYGYSVFVNRTSAVLPRYHIIAGDSHFVKSFLQTRAKDHQERLVIVWDAHPEEFRMFSDTHVKIALVDHRILTGEDVRELFRFYFTSRESLTDRRTKIVPNLSRIKQPISNEHIYPAPEVMNRDETEKHKEIEKSAKDTDERNVLEETDRLRIDSLIRDVFSPEVAQQKKVQRFRPLRTIVLVMSIVLLPFLWYTISVLLAGSAVIVSAKLLSSGVSREGTIAARIGLFGVSQGATTLSLIRLPFGLVGWGDSAIHQEQLLTIFDNILKAEIEAGTTVAVGRELAASLLSPVGLMPDATPPAVGIERIRTGISSINHRLGVADAMFGTLIKNNSFPFSLPLVRVLGRRAQRSLTSTRETTTQLERFLVLYPQIAGFRQTQTYLVLFQNSLELRPTGGFIGSLALVHVRDGRLVDYTIHDVYTVDGQLKGHVDPPTPIRELLSQEHWYLRDSNWDPDFRISGERARWFYEKETGTLVDGVIGISVPYIVDILSATGPIDLSDINDRITAENFFGKSLFYTQTNFFPGSTQKKDFLGSLANALILKITQDRRASPVGIYEATIRALTSRDILFSFADPYIQELVSQNGWTGTIDLHAGCTRAISSCIPQGIAVIDANLSVNKANYFLKTSRLRLIDLAADGSVSETMTLNYHNTSTGTEQGSGAYRSYTRVYLPQDVTVSGIFLDGASVKVKKEATDSSEIVLPYWEIASSSASAYAIGIGFDVPEGQERSLSISIKRESGWSLTQEETVIGIYDHKQPGVSRVEEQVLIRYPITFDVRIDEARGGTIQDGIDAGVFLAKQGQVEYNTTLSSDFVLQLTLIRQ